MTKDKTLTAVAKAKLQDKFERIMFDGLMEQTGNSHSTVFPYGQHDGSAALGICIDGEDVNLGLMSGELAKAAYDAVMAGEEVQQMIQALHYYNDRKEFKGHAFIAERALKNFLTNQEQAND